MVKAKLMSLPKGGKVIKCRVTTELTRYDLLAAAIYARQEGETEMTRGSLIRYMRRILEEKGVEGFVRLYNEASACQLQLAGQAISDLFPEL